MKSIGLAIGIVGVLWWSVSGAAAGVVPVPTDEELEIRVWTDRGEGAVYDRGDRIVVYFEASRDCYVTLVHMDTEGYVRILFPYEYDDSPFVRGGRVYRVPDPGDRYDLVVTGPMGIEYIQAIASLHPYPIPLWPRYWDSLRRWRGRFGKLEIRFIERISGDPFVGMIEIAGALLPAGYAHPIATDFYSFYVDEEVWYPRTVCYECHRRPSRFRIWRRFDPYRSMCAIYEVRVYEDWRYVRHVRTIRKKTVERYRKPRWYVQKKEKKRPARPTMVRKRAGAVNFVRIKEDPETRRDKYGAVRTKEKKAPIREKAVKARRARKGKGAREGEQKERKSEGKRKKEKGKRRR